MKFSVFSFSFLMLLLFSSCATTSYYAPDDGNLLVISEKNALNISGSMDAQEGGYNGDVGYSPAKGIAVTGAFSYINRRAIEQELYSIAAGYYLRKEKYHKKYESFRFKGMRQAFVFDLYGGYGLGHNHFYRSNFRYQRFYIQPGFHFMQDFVSLSLVGRTVWLDYISGTTLGAITNDYKESLRQLEVGNPYFHIEGFFRLQLGGDRLRFYISTGSAFYNERPFKGRRPIFLRVGMMLELGKFIFKKKDDVRSEDEDL